MTLGEHLDELRGRLIRAIVAIVIVSIPCAWLVQYLLAWIARPLILATRMYDQPETFLATSPVEPFLIYVKVVLISGLTIAGPYVVYQMWSFVAAGLYPRERAWVYRLVPFSVGLFVFGVVFMYVFVLPLSLKFLVGFGSWLKMPDISPTLLDERLMGVHSPATQEAANEEGGAEAAMPPVPVLTRDPQSPVAGQVWFNLFERRLKVATGEEVFSYQMQRDGHRSLVTTHFTIGKYLTFVLMLTIAFGVAFQMPLVVLFLVRSGLVPIEVLRKYRRVVILAIVIVAGGIAPPDLMSHLLLAAPMYLLFELGLLLASRKRAGPARA